MIRWATAMEDGTMITIERCRNHETKSNPQAWEIVETHSDPRQAAVALERRISPRPANGDQYRVVDDGAEFDGLDYLRAFA